MMTSNLALSVAAIASLMLAGCSKQEEHGSHGSHGSHAGSKTEHSMHDMHGKGAHMDMDQDHQGGKPVELTAEGRKLDPPITPAQVPAGAWYCDMGGSVHFARTDQGDGTCPVCHMKLRQAPAQR